MVVLELDDSYRYVEKRLGNLKSKTPKVLAKSINDTAKWARRALADEARKTYTVRLAGFNGAMKIKNARYSNLEAIIKTEGETIQLVKYHKSAGKKATKAEVLSGGGLKALEKKGIKAFVAKTSNGHTGIYQRKYRYDKDNPSYRKPKNFADKSARNHNRKIHGKPIKTLFSNSIPMMIGNEDRVYGIVEPKINEYLQKQIDRHIEKVLGGYE